MNFPFENNDYLYWDFKAFAIECGANCGYVVTHVNAGWSTKNQISVSRLEPAQILKIRIFAQRQGGEASEAFFTGSSLPYQASTPTATPTPTITQNPNTAWISECDNLDSTYKWTFFKPKQIEIQREIIRVTKSDSKLSKSENKIIIDADQLRQKLQELSYLDCRKISESIWNQIKDERLTQVQSVYSLIEPTLAALRSIKTIEIICNKKGILKTIVGKTPKCPTGYKLVS